ncbi:MAG: DUF1731 domain-containing protein [Bergeyella sp.]|nr:DUF1731 domain-containing protein [Bergeyella sp.]
MSLSCFISASGINYYGSFTSNALLTEKDPRKRCDFLSEVCNAWENAADEFSVITERIVKLRISAVLSSKKGFLEALKKITNNHPRFRNLAAANNGLTGYIIEDSLCPILSRCKTPMYGSYNTVSDEYTTQKMFMKKLAKNMNRYFFSINIPAFAVRLFLEEMSEMISGRNRASNEKIKRSGFELKYPSLSSALALDSIFT